MDQPTFADLDYQTKKRKTRREVFLERMDGLIPWERLEERIRPVYPKAGKGRRPYPLPVMLRIHCVQLFYNLSNPGMEDLLYEAESVRRFTGLRLSDALPNEPTILNFRHLLEGHDLGKGLFEEINAHLESQGLRLREGTIVDASITLAPSSTKNRAEERDPEMHQTRKGNQWHFGMKLHIGVDSDTGLVHSMTTTAANAHDVTEAHHLLHGGETVVWGDAGYQGGAQTRGEPGPGSGLAGGDEARTAPETGTWERGDIGREAQGVGDGEGGASVPADEAGVRLLEGALPGTGEEHSAPGNAAGSGQPDDGPAASDGVAARPAGLNQPSGAAPDSQGSCWGRIQRRWAISNKGKGRLTTRILVQ